MARILVLGAGFAGLWAAVGAARKLAELGTRAPGDVEILVVDRNPYHNIRVRNYESDLSAVAIPLREVLDPIGVKHVAAEIETIDVAKQQVVVATPRSREVLAYDRLVLATGSVLTRPDLPGLASSCFDVDTYAAAVRLNAHIAVLGARPDSAGRSTVVVVGAGLTGVEVATEMPGKLAGALPADRHRVILVDSNPVVGSTMGDSARPVIGEGLAALGIETRLGAKVAAVDARSVTLASGEVIPTDTVVWCAGMRASPIAAALDGKHDRLGRLAVDPFMRATGLTNVFAAGDVAMSLVDGVHPSVMSCQFARPMGRFAGHNVVADLFGRPMLPLRIDWYVTVLDLGPGGGRCTPPDGIAGCSRRDMTPRRSKRPSTASASIRRQAGHAKRFSRRPRQSCKRRRNTARQPQRDLKVAVCRNSKLGEQVIHGPAMRARHGTASLCASAANLLACYGSKPLSNERQMPPSAGKPVQ